MKMSQDNKENDERRKRWQGGETSVVPYVVWCTPVQRQFGERSAPRKSAGGDRAAEAAGAVADPCRVRELWRQMTDRGL